MLPWRLTQLMEYALASNDISRSVCVCDCVCVLSDVTIFFSNRMLNAIVLA